MFVVIMAGGGGTRLWPKSRVKKPKQLQALISQESMIKNTTQRLSSLVSPNKIYIATNKEQIEDIKKDVPEIQNIIEEPFMRNTGPCIGLAAIYLKNTNESVAFLPSDHYIGNEKEFLRVLKQADAVAQKDYLVTLGIRPTDADTGMGYIKIGEQLGDNFFEVEKFIEKPDLKTAKKFLASGNYLWNGGIFIAKPQVILDLFKENAPDIYQGLIKIAQNPKNLEKEYEKMENISFDYAIVEKTKKIAVVPGDFDWSDIGNWSKLLEKLLQNAGENVVIGCEHYGVDTKGCLIHGTERLVATIGLKDVIVVDTPDAVLVCHKDKTQDVRKIVEKLKEEKREEYL